MRGFSFLWNLIAGGTKSYYDMLGVEPTASVKDIKKAYHRLALAHHSDRNRNADDEMMKKLNRIYSVLSDPAKRKIYDAGGECALTAHERQHFNQQAAHSSFGTSSFPSDAHARAYSPPPPPAQEPLSRLLQLYDLGAIYTTMEEVMGGSGSVGRDRGKLAFIDAQLADNSIGFIGECLHRAIDADLVCSGCGRKFISPDELCYCRRGQVKSHCLNACCNKC